MVSVTVEDILSEVKPFFTYSKELKEAAPLISYRSEWLGLKLGLTLLTDYKKKPDANQQLLAVANSFLTKKLD